MKVRDYNDIGRYIIKTLFSKQLSMIKKNHHIIHHPKNIYLKFCITVYKKILRRIRCALYPNAVPEKINNQKFLQVMQGIIDPTNETDQFLLALCKGKFDNAQQALAAYPKV